MATEEDDETVETVLKPSTRLGFVFNFNKKSFPHFSIDTIIGEANEEHNAFTGKVEMLDITKYIDTSNYDPSDVSLLNNVRKLQDSSLKSTSYGIRRLLKCLKSLPFQPNLIRTRKS
ncbi:hypothetical protein [Niabella ginsengisoli]|uniref:Uncharacterized protein n=1 Tax=Niabella ginsengisoli TaxID=522298 RepID=A0ABS9SNI6_9BACT|nr:hypothetical protein [Niabella ginsengisoli]MCH5599898.1 hypothetical protein [Niabella ginsengisoli]